MKSVVVEIKAYFCKGFLGVKQSSGYQSHLLLGLLEEMCFFPRFCCYTYCIAHGAKLINIRIVRLHQQITVLR